MSVRHPKKPKKNERGRENTRPIEYTREIILGVFEDMRKIMEKDQTIVFIGELCVLVRKPRVVPREYVSRWAKDYKDDEQIRQAIREIETTLESRVAKGGLTGKYNANFTKFHMVNNHDWRDKKEVDPNPGDGPNSLSKVFDAAEQRKKK